jgi:hypothetical protein
MTTPSARAVPDRLPVRVTARKKRTSSYCQGPGVLFIHEQHMSAKRTCKEVLAHLGLEEGLISRQLVMNLAMVFRLVIAAQARDLLPQVLLAGLGLSGSETALDAHMSFEGAILVVSAAQVIAALLLRRSARISEIAGCRHIGCGSLMLCRWWQVVCSCLPCISRWACAVRRINRARDLCLCDRCKLPSHRELAPVRSLQRAANRREAMISLLTALLLSAFMFFGAHDDLEVSMLDGIGTALVGVALAVILTTIVTTSRSGFLAGSSSPARPARVVASQPQSPAQALSRIH